jgi:transcription elongation factor B subunit 1
MSSLHVNTLQGSLLSLRKKKPVPPPPSGAAPIFKEDYVTLISREGHAFILERKVACVSKLIRAYVSSGTANASPHDARIAAATSTSPDVNWEASEPAVVRFPFVSSAHLEKAVQYFHFKHKYDNDPDHRPDFHVPPEMAVDLIKVATLLQC